MVLEGVIELHIFNFRNCSIDVEYKNLK